LQPYISTNIAAWLLDDRITPLGAENNTKEGKRQNQNKKITGTTDDNPAAIKQPVAMKNTLKTTLPD
jgi:hypothetical protein